MDTIIRRKKTDLMKWLRMNTIVLQHVDSSEIITQTEYNRLRQIRDDDDRNIELIDIIVQKGPAVSQTFFNILADNEVNESSPDLKKWTSSVISSGTSETSVTPGAHVSTSANNTNSSTSSAGNRRIADNKEFLRKKRSKLIQNVTNVAEIADVLNLSDEKRSIVAAQTTEHNKMRKVLEYTNSTKAAEQLIKALWEHAEDVMEDLTSNDE